MKKIILSIVSIFISVYPLSSQKSERPSGSGTPSSPYAISTLANLRWLSENPSIWKAGICFIQTSDIDAQETGTWNKGAGFSPIGNSLNPFKGAYDGKGYVIYSLIIKRPVSSETGLFGYALGATIKNLDLNDCNITGSRNVGILAGYIKSGTIDNCSGNGEITAGYGSCSSVGSLAGYAAESQISKCHASGTIDAFGSDSDSLRNIGGLAGYVLNCNIISSFTSVTIKISAGLCSDAGGFCGNITSDFGTSNISHCYSRSPIYISTFTAANVGGFSGVLSNSIISKCYSAGILSTPPNSKNVGGFLGLNDNNSSPVNSSFWDIEAASQGSIRGAGTGKNTNYMKSESTYSQAGWNFNIVWSISSSVNDGYPNLEKWYLGTAMNTY
jgi:hypothetical protein